MSKEVMKFPDPTISTSEAFESFFNKEIEIIDELSGDELLARVLGVILYFNNLSETQKVGLLERIVEYLRKLKEKLDKIAKFWGVSNYSIGVSAPWGINISLTFTPIPGARVENVIEVKEKIQKSSKSSKIPRSVLKKMRQT